MRLCWWLYQIIVVWQCVFILAWKYRCKAVNGSWWEDIRRMCARKAIYCIQSNVVFCQRIYVINEFIIRFSHTLFVSSSLWCLIFCMGSKFHIKEPMNYGISGNEHLGAEEQKIKTLSSGILFIFKLLEWHCLFWCFMAFI